ncbi:NUDIX domain-containing protein [Paenibacillus sp. CAU 1782]
MSIDKTKYPTLAAPIFWEPVESRFAAGACGDESMVSNISLVPTVGDKYVMMQLEDGRWELIGGTLEPGELYMDGLERELMEEIGAELETFSLVGHFACHSTAEYPYRPHIPHPRFVRLIGTGEVTLVAPPSNPQDGEAVARVELMEISEAVRLFRSQGRHDLAELYLFAHEWRSSGERIREAEISPI